MARTDMAELILAPSAPEDIAAARLCSNEEQRKKLYKSIFPHPMHQGATKSAECWEHPKIPGTANQKFILGGMP